MYVCVHSDVPQHSLGVKSLATSIPHFRNQQGELTADDEEKDEEKQLTHLSD